MSPSPPSDAAGGAEHSVRARTAATRAVRAAVLFDRAAVSPRAGIVAAIPVAGMLVLGTAVGQPIAAVTMAVGAMLVGVAWRGAGGPADPPLGTMAGAAGALAFATLTGTVSGRWPWLHLGLLAVFCLIAGWATSLGRRGAVPGTQAIIAFVVFGRFPESVPGGLVLAGLVLLGGASQVGLAALLARPAAWRAQRSALAGAYRRLAEQAAAPGAGARGTADALAAADMRLSAPAVFADPALLALTDLAAVGRRIRLELIALQTTASGVATPDELGRDGSSSGPGNGAREVLAAIAQVLTLVADRIDRGTPSEEAALAAVASLHALGETRPRLDDAASVAQARLDGHLAALIGQVTAAAQLAARTGGADRALRETRRSRGAPVPLRGLRADASRLRGAMGLRSSAGRHALRLAIVVAGTELLTQRVALPRGYWAVVAAATVLRPDFGATFTRGAERMLGTLGGVVVASFVVVALQPGGWGIAGVVAALAWVTYSVFPASYTAGTAGLTAVVVFLLRAAAPDSVTIALDRGLDTLIGGGIGLAAYALWPTWSGRTTGVRLADVVADQRVYLRAVFRALVAGRPVPEEEVRPLARRARIAWGDAEAAVTLARVEPARRGTTDPATAGATLAALRRVVYAIHSLRVEAWSDELEPEPELAPLAQAIDAGLSALEAALRPPAARSQIPPLRALLRRMPHAEDERGRGERLILDELIDAIDTAADALGVPVAAAQPQPAPRV